MSRTVVLIHGAWLAPASFDLFQGRYEARGYTVLSPPWPHMNRPVADLRESPRPDLAGLTVARIVAHYERVIRQLLEPPIIIGHSFGGLIVQMLLDRRLGAAGVAIDPAPARGVLPGLDALISSRRVFLALNGWNRVLRMSFESFCEGFAQTLPPAEQRAHYERQIVPAPGRIFYQAALGIGVAVNFANSNRAPLLLVSADQDRTVTPWMVRAAHAKYRRSKSTTELKVFSGRSHALIFEPGWEEVADYALHWALTHRRRSTASRGGGVERVAMAADGPRGV